MKFRKLAVRLSSQLIEALDRHVGMDGRVSRDTVVEEALSKFLEAESTNCENLTREQERELYRSYYASLSPEAKLEAEVWRSQGTG